MLTVWLLSWVILAAAVYVAALVVPGVHVKGVGGAFVVAAVFGVLNLLLGKLLFIVIGIGTLGIGFLLAFLTRWIVCAVLLKITDALTDSLTVRGFGPAFLAALVMSAIGTLGEYLLRIRV